MKNNKSLFALALVGIISLPVMAQENNVSVVDVQKIKRDAQRQSELSTEVSLLKLELERATLQQQIAESQASVQALHNQAQESEEVKKLKAEFEEKLLEQEERLKNLQHQNARLSAKKVEEKKKASQPSPIDTVFVTSVRGIGNNLTAQFYVNNDVVYRRKGDFVTDGVFVENVTANGALIRVKDKTKFLPVTTVEQAHFKVVKTPAFAEEQNRGNSGRNRD